MAATVFMLMTLLVGIAAALDFTVCAEDNTGKGVDVYCPSGSTVKGTPTCNGLDAQGNSVQTVLALSNNFDDFFGNRVSGAFCACPDDQNDCIAKVTLTCEATPGVDVLVAPVFVSPRTVVPGQKISDSLVCPRGLNFAGRTRDTSKGGCRKSRSFGIAKNDPCGSGTTLRGDAVECTNDNTTNLRCLCSLQIKCVVPN